MTDILEQAAAERVCANCSTPASGRYCHACGQRIGVHRLTLSHMLHEIPHAIFHVDRGILVTLRALATRPGRTINDYLDGHRVRYFNPLSLLMLLAGICTYAYANFPLNFDFSDDRIPRELSKFNASINHWIFIHYSLMAVLNLPVQALISWLLFRGRRNFGEHLAIHAFIASFGCLLNLLFIPAFIATNGTAAFMHLWLLNSVVMLSYNLFATLKVFAPHRSKIGGVIRALVTVLTPVFMGMIAIWGMVAWFLFQHPELLEQFKPPRH